MVRSIIISPFPAEAYQNGGLDVHRLVLMFGYKFTPKTQFITEIEFEHVKEVFVEQAFLQHEITPWLKIQGRFDAGSHGHYQ